MQKGNNAQGQPIIECERCGKPGETVPPDPHAKGIGKYFPIAKGIVVYRGEFLCRDCLQIVRGAKVG